MSTAKSFAELFLCRKPRTLLDLPKLMEAVVDRITAPERQKMNSDKSARSRKFVIDQLVLVIVFRAYRKHKWARGTVLKATGIFMRLVKVSDQVWRRHVHQILDKNSLIDEEHFDALQHSEAVGTQPAQRLEAAPVNEVFNRKSSGAADNDMELRRDEAATVPRALAEYLARPLPSKPASSKYQTRSFKWAAPTGAEEERNMVRRVH